MPTAGIVGLGSYVPPRVMTNEDWAGLVETSDEWITMKTGIKEAEEAEAKRIADEEAAKKEAEEAEIGRASCRERV